MFASENGIAFLHEQVEGHEVEFTDLLCSQWIAGEVLLYIVEYGVWPQVNAYDTFHFVRKANDREGDVGSFPGETLDSTSPYARALVHTALCSEWDFCLLRRDLKFFSLNTRCKLTTHGCQLLTTHAFQFGKIGVCCRRWM